MFNVSSDAMSNAFNNAGLSNPEGEPVEQSSLTENKAETPAAPVETPVETPPVEAQKPVEETPQVTETTKEVPTDKPIEKPIEEKKPVEKVVETPPQKTWEEELAERTGGNFKSFEEVQSTIDGYKQAAEKNPFHNEDIKRYNELAKEGVVFDKKFWEVQGKDYKSISNPEEVILEHMATLGNYEGYSKEQLVAEFNYKYKKSEWSMEDEDPTETENIMQMRIKRDSDSALNELLSNQEKLNVVTKPDPEAIERQKVEQETQQENWNSYVDSIAEETKKLTTVIDVKNDISVDFEVSKEDHEAVSSVMKQLTTNVDAFFGQYKDAEGNYDNKAMYKALLVLRRHDDIVKVAVSNAEARGAEKEVTELKNTNFTQAGGSNAKAPPKADAEALAIAESFRE